MKENEEGSNVPAANDGKYERKRNVFRGRNEKGEWLTGDLLHLAKEAFIAPFDGDWFDFIPWEEKNIFHSPLNDYSVDKETIGQYAGVQDKDGKDVYEGDIVECVSWNEFFSIPTTGQVMEPYRRRMEVGFRNGGFKLIEPPIYQGGEERVWDIIYNGDIVIVGNIHDNKDLLQNKTLVEHLSECSKDQ